MTESEIRTRVQQVFKKIYGREPTEQEEWAFAESEVIPTLQWMVAQEQEIQE